jgi:methylenetetrahydrofolate reductase (NADPH)
MMNGHAALRHDPGGPPFRLSFEFFPPKSPEQAAALDDTLLRLRPFRPDFVSVTYGAGGTTRDGSIETVRRIRQELHMPVAAHLTCVSATCEALDEVVRAVHGHGVRHIVALRGDPPGGVGQRYRPHPGGYEDTADMIRGLRRIAPFEISVAAYPERHPESPDWATELDILKRKADAGAQRAMTQFFFDNDLYERYLERVRAAGIWLPIVPGLMLIQGFSGVCSFAKRCGASIPAWLAERFEAAGDDRERHRAVAAEVAAEQMGDLVRRGADEFHLYTMNRADVVEAILTVPEKQAARRRSAA